MVRRSMSLWVAALALLCASWHAHARAQASCEDPDCAPRASRWIAAVPFGVGQFQNGDAGLGAFFLVSEVALLGVSVTLWVQHEDMRSELIAPSEIERVRADERVLRWGNWTAMALLGATATAGILEAQLNVDKVPAVIAIGPGSTQLRVRF